MLSRAWRRSTSASCFSCHHARLSAALGRHGAFLRPASCQVTLVLFFPLALDLGLLPEAIGPDRVPVELDGPESAPEQERWSPAEAARFFAQTAADPIGLVFRISTLCPSRRSEICGLEWHDWNDAEATFEVRQLLLHSG